MVVWAVACNMCMHLMCRRRLCSLRSLLSWATTGQREVDLRVTEKF